MDYYFDTEFLEGPQKKRILGVPYGKTKNTIDLISIGIVCEDGREYYAISKDFNLKEAWNRYDLKPKDAAEGYNGNYSKKDYWIRENVLKPIYWDMMNMGNPKEFTVKRKNDFNYKNFKRLLNRYGKSNEQIAEEIKYFVGKGYDKERFLDLQRKGESLNRALEVAKKEIKPVFHAYYADYDWVVFCWLFGRMIDLPKGFPMYCVDIKQIMDEKATKLMDEVCYSSGNHTIINHKEALKEIKNNPNYPVNNNTHHALSDAKFDRDLHNFLNKTYEKIN